MSGETEKAVSGWTTDTLHTHLVRQLDLLRDSIADHYRSDDQARTIAFRAQETAMNAALASAKEAVSAALAAQQKEVTVANAANEKRLDSVNEFRGQLSDMIRTLMPRAEAEAIIARATERIQDLATAMAQTVTRAEWDAQHQRDSERIAELTNRLTTAEAMARGAQGNKAQVIAVMGIVCTVIVATIVIANFLAR